MDFLFSISIGAIGAVPNQSFSIRSTRGPLLKYNDCDSLTRAAGIIINLSVATWILFGYISTPVRYARVCVYWSLQHCKLVIVTTKKRCHHKVTKIINSSQHHRRSFGNFESITTHLITMPLGYSHTCTVCTSLNMQFKWTVDFFPFSRFSKQNDVLFCLLHQTVSSCAR